MNQKLIVLLFGLLVAAISCTPKVTVDKDKALVDSLLTAYDVLWNCQDPAKALTMWADDGIMMFQDQVDISGKDSLLAFCNLHVPNLRNFTSIRGDFAVNNDLITINSMYSFEYLGGDQVLYPNKGIALQYAKKQPDGTWKLVLGVYHQAFVVK